MTRSYPVLLLPLQAVITAGKEDVLNERLCWAHFGRTLVTGTSGALREGRASAMLAQPQRSVAGEAAWEAAWLAHPRRSDGKEEEVS